MKKLLGKLLPVDSTFSHILIKKVFFRAQVLGAPWKSLIKLHVNPLAWNHQTVVDWNGRMKLDSPVKKNFQNFCHTRGLYKQIRLTLEIPVGV